MSLNTAFGNALSGLAATSRRAEVVSANLANALTDGYGRRSLDVSAASIGGTGAGVRIDGVSRHVDRGLLAERRGAETLAERRSALLDGLTSLEAAFGSTEEGTSLSARIAAFEGALVSLSADPSSEPRQAQALDRLDAAAAALRGSATAVQRQRAEADGSIARMVEGLNADLQGIERLNKDIVVARVRGADAAGLLDQRQVLIDRVATLVPVREMDRGQGTVALITPAGATLLDGRAAWVDFAASPTITAGMTLAGGALGGLTIDGAPAGPAGTGGAGRLAGGALGAAFELRDATLPAAAESLDALARDLIERLEAPTADPTRGAGPGLLTDGGAALAAAPAPGLASRLQVNAAVDPDRGGALWRLRDGVGAAAPGPAGEGAQVVRWLDALAAPRALAAGGRAGGAADLAAGAEAGIGAARLAAEEEAAFASARWSSFREAELAGGVDSDREMQDLLRVEQAYAANAKVIEALDAMTRTLLEI